MSLFKIFSFSANNRKAGAKIGWVYYMKEAFRVQLCFVRIFSSVIANEAFDWSLTWSEMLERRGLESACD